MADTDKVVVIEEDVYEVTGKGTGELSAGGTTLTPSEIELLVQIDGSSTVAEIKTRIPLLAPDAVIASFKKLSWHNYIKVSDKANALDFVEFFSTKKSTPAPGDLNVAKAEAETGASTLKRDGYYVRIARRAVEERQLEKGQVLSILVIDDEPYLGKFLKQLLTLEGYSARIATNRAEIVAELTRAPRPDLVLLDVMLPDTDGFDILLKMRQHRDLKLVPVIMLTAKATRAAVLTGLAGGADGYITKPVDAEVLLKAVKTVLGLTPA